jgi:hypothetical protein
VSRPISIPHKVRYRAITIRDFSARSRATWRGGSDRRSVERPIAHQTDRTRLLPAVATRSSLDLQRPQKLIHRRNSTTLAPHFPKCRRTFTLPPSAPDCTTLPFTPLHHLRYLYHFDLSPFFPTSELAIPSGLNRRNAAPTQILRSTTLEYPNWQRMAARHLDSGKRPTPLSFNAFWADMLAHLLQDVASSDLQPSPPRPQK